MTRANVCALACALALALGGCTVQDQLAAAKGALDALRSEQRAEIERDPIRAYFEARNMSEAAGDAEEMADWCEEVGDRWGDDALDDSPTYDQVCERLLLRLLAEPDCPDTPERAPRGAVRPTAAGTSLGTSVPQSPPPASLPAAVAAAEGLHDPPAPGAVSGDLHGGHGANLSDAARRLEGQLWAEAVRWASRWTDAEACRGALAEIHYALGAARIREFTRMLGEIESADWPEAAYELRQSKWARQVGPRAERIAAALAEDCPQ